MKKLVQYLNDHFVPHEGNDHQPYFLRTKTAFLIAMMLFAAEALYLLGTLVILPRSDMFAAILASVLAEQTNEKRIEDSVGTLEWSPVLERAAQMKANDMAEKGYFSHNTPDGKTPWYWFRLAGYDYAAAGENLAVNFVDSRDVTEAWMRSPTHRANMLNSSYTEIGIATARGTYKGREAIFVVQLFGRPGILASHTPSRTTPDGGPRREIARASSSHPLLATARPEALGESTTDGDTNPADQADASPLTTALEGDAAIASPSGDIQSPQMRTNFTARAIAAPRFVSTGFAVFFLLLFILALGLNIFIKVRIQHLSLVANGVLLAGVVMAFIIMNAAIAAVLGTI